MLKTSQLGGSRGNIGGHGQQPYEGVLTAIRLEVWDKLLVIWHLGCEKKEAKSSNMAEMTMNRQVGQTQNATNRHLLTKNSLSQQVVAGQDFGRLPLVAKHQNVE